MPPPAAHQKRMTANPARPQRFRPGKAHYEERNFTSSEDESDDAVQSKAPSQTQARSQVQPPTAQTTSRPAPPKVTSFPRTAETLLNVDLEARRQRALQAEARLKKLERLEREEAEREAGFVTESEDDSASGSGSGSEARSRTRPKAQSGPKQGGANDESESEDEDEEDSDSESDSSSEDDRPKLIRPTFIKKADRKKEPASLNEENAAVAEAEARRRQEAADALVIDRIEKDKQARAAGRKGWDDDTPLAEEYPDDTDGLDPELEKKQWIARELARIKRVKDRLREREEELEELERRRDMTEAERDAEDMDKVKAQEEERKSRGQLGYMQKYYHAPAFHRGDEDEETKKLLSRDLAGHKVQDETDKSLLPSALQMRDQTKIGKKGATKYKDLRAEDTGRFGNVDDRRRGQDGNLDERFRPDGPGGRESATGANAGGLGKRKAFPDEREAKRPRTDEVR